MSDLLGRNRMEKDMNTGLCCGRCGQRFVAEHGKKVLCDPCWRCTPSAKRWGYSKAIQSIVRPEEDPQ